MPSRSSFKLTGAKELEALLKSMGPEVATKAGTSGMRKAANIARDAVREAAPYDEGDTSRTYTRNAKGGGRESVTADYGHLRDNIKTRKVKARTGNTIAFEVTTGSAFWGQFSEFGTEHEPARPWFKPALDKAIGSVVDAITVEIKSAVDRAARKGKR